MDISTPLTSWETILFSIQGIEPRIDYLEKTLIEMNTLYEWCLDRKMVCINDNMHLEDSISEPGVMKIHTQNERKIKGYQDDSKEWENQIERARNYLNSFYCWNENKHLLPQEPPQSENNKIGESKLTKDQISLLAFYLRKVGTISPGATNKQLANSFSLITQFAKGQLSKTIKKDNSESFAITNKEKDFADLTNHLKELTKKIDADRTKYKLDSEIE